MTCTIYENIYSKEPHHIPIADALDRIKNGKSKAKIEEIRCAMDKEKAEALKRQLPSICFSGVFHDREDNKILQHSGFLVMDFDEVADLEVKATELYSKPFVYAVWLSPRGNGLKALVRLADGKKHRLHFAALKEIFPDIDKSGVNESRVCYESYDPSLYINPDAVPFTKIVEVTKIESRETVADERDIFQKLLKWITNKGDAFVKGERNTYIFKLAGSCCRFGIQQDSAVSLILNEYPPSNDFSQKECVKAIESAYKRGNFGSARFEKDILVDKTSHREVEIDASVFDLDAQPKDVIYGAMVKANAMAIYQNGYAAVAGIGAGEFDNYFKAKKGEVTCISGIGNYGKSALYKWFLLMRVLKFGEKFASFSPEDNPPEEYYHDFVEMLLGGDCTPKNVERRSIEEYSNAYDFVSSHIFYVYPKELSPTPAYVKERFLELIIKEKVSGVGIDPFNQMSHDYGISGGRSDKYLETVLGDFSRFAQQNSVYFFIIMHPNKMNKNGANDYPCPDVFDLADGAMWNNKMDNILIYHRPFAQSNPTDRSCELHTKKIKRQKIVGQKGMLAFEYNRRTRRFDIGNHDYMSDLLAQNSLDFVKPVTNYMPRDLPVPKHYDNVRLPYYDQNKSESLPKNFFNEP